MPAKGAVGVGMLGNSDDEVAPLKHRLHAIMKFRPGTRIWVVGFCTWLAVALVGLTDPVPRPGPEIGQVQTAASSLV